MYKYQRVRDLREDADKTQKEIAKILNKQTTVYRNWESGHREIPTHIIIELCKFYNVSADYMLGLTNIKKALPNDKKEKQESKTIKITGYNIEIENL